jgi:hypothetical protein
LAIGGLNGFDLAEVQNSSSVLRLNFGTNNPAHHQYVNRCATFDEKELNNNNASSADLHE